MINKKYKIAYVVSTLKRVGPNNQTLNIIKNSIFKEESVVITLFPLSENDSMIDEYRFENIEIVNLNLNPNLFFLNGAKILHETLIKYDISIAHSYGVKADYLTQKACKNSSVSHVITLRNYPKEDILTRMNKIYGLVVLFIHLKVLRNSKNLICCSKAIYKKMKRDYPNLKITYIQNGTDINKFFTISKQKKLLLRKNYQFSEEDKLFISTGSFIPRKRIEELITIFDSLEEANKKLLLLGDGPLLDELRKKYKDNHNLFFLGKKKDIIEYLQVCDYFISSSESEGLPNSVIEAIACGVPVILSNIEQHIEIFNELGKVGYTYELGNIKDALKKYAKINSEEYREFIENTKNIKNSNLTMKNMSLKYCEYYENLKKGIRGNNNE